MPAWTPRDLANSEFVATKLSDKDRNTALYSTNNELQRYTSVLDRLQQEYKSAEDAFNARPERGVINGLRAKAKDETLSAEERTAAQQQADALAEERARLTDVWDKATIKLDDAKIYYGFLEQGKSNLLAAGAVEPGTNMFAPPPGYDGRSGVSAQVPASQNPNPTPSTDTGYTENAVPASVEGDATAAAEREFVNIEEQRQLETELGATQAEADLIIQAQKEADQLEYETQLGATQAEADAIARAQLEANQNEYAFGGTQDEADAIIRAQKEISDAEASLGAGGATQAEADAINQALKEQGLQGFTVPKGISSSLLNTQSQGTQQDSTNALAKGDWRVRLSLAPGAKYLYAGDNAGILAPLAETGGVLFPYTPAIQVNYAASYDTQELVHSNYKNFQYKSSSVDNITIACDFTAQDVKEARYILAVIHFFRSVTKMFYGQDQNPKNGVPPPLCYLTGMGAFQFDRHPLAITQFNLSLPTDVDYIRAGSVNDNPGVDTNAEFSKNNTFSQALNNLSQSITKIAPGGITPLPQFKTRPSGSTEATYVPTKINISISAIPINSRNSISNNFSLRDYGSGQLLRGSKNKTGTGMW